MDRQTISTEQEKEVKEIKSVLIVEDEAIMRESLRDWLKDRGYEVDTAKEGERYYRRLGRENLVLRFSM